MTTHTKTGKLCSHYLDQISRERLQALAHEMTISRSSVVRILIAQAWKDRSDPMITAVKNFDLNQREGALLRAGIDPMAMLLSTAKAGK